MADRPEWDDDFAALEAGRLIDDSGNVSGSPEQLDEMAGLLDEFAADDAARWGGRSDAADRMRAAARELRRQAAEPVNG